MARNRFGFDLTNDSDTGNTLYWRWGCTNDVRNQTYAVYCKFKGVEYFMGTTMKWAREAMIEWEERLLLEGTQVISLGAN